MKNITLKNVLSLMFLVLFGGSSFAYSSCPNPPLANGPDLIQYCENYADQRANRYNFSAWYSHLNQCINLYGPCVGAGSSSGGSSGGSSTSSSGGGSGNPSQCSQYATSFCGTSNQQSACWQQRYQICMGS